MQTARVLGHARATVKHDSLVGRRLVIAQPLLLSGDADGPPLLVLDKLGCRSGDLVVLTSDGTAVRDITGSDVCPARWSVCGLVD
ncbi:MULTISPECIES: EutN/CcmL family microcompartment protein [Pirellulaceae]|uniref:Ethanolamine utilization protein EutN n=1 Tax=Aporhodopirellula rubra TaxID=980271 RepID=A0A7W5H797_9BACT|nr:MULTISPECIES: EutN/CcmL family microcompartment protein [Pirellulaceae]EMI41915.1 Ethanolamine utilization protein EutN/carboxysome structural protein Ccml [Rhodopirellula sp. SWK7]MBB3207726.1 ethanolamine utilization protein EutN [Aporhodopirellula rubra]